MTGGGVGCVGSGRAGRMDSMMNGGGALPFSLLFLNTISHASQQMVKAPTYPSISTSRHGQGSGNTIPLASLSTMLITLSQASHCTFCSSQRVTAYTSCPAQFRG